MLKRTFDATQTNELANRPDIRPFIGGDPSIPLDFAGPIANRDNVFIDGEHGSLAFAWSAPFVFEVHIMVAPEGRGRWARDFALEARNTIVHEFGALQLWLQIDPLARHTKTFARWLSFCPAGTHTVDCGIGPVKYNLYSWRA